MYKIIIIICIIVIPDALISNFLVKQKYSKGFICQTKTSWKLTAYSNWPQTIYRELVTGIIHWMIVNNELI